MSTYRFDVSEHNGTITRATLVRLGDEYLGSGDGGNR